MKNILSKITAAFLYKELLMLFNDAHQIEFVVANVYEKISYHVNSTSSNNISSILNNNRVGVDTVAPRISLQFFFSQKG